MRRKPSPKLVPAPCLDMKKELLYERLKDPMSLVEAILRIDIAFTALRTNGLNMRAILVLLHDLTKVSKENIAAILHGLETLKAEYCMDNPAP